MPLRACSKQSRTHCFADATQSALVTALEAEVSNISALSTEDSLIPAAWFGPNGQGGEQLPRGACLPDAWQLMPEVAQLIDRHVAHATLSLIHI